MDPLETFVLEQSWCHSSKLRESQRRKPRSNHLPDAQDKHRPSPIPPPTLTLASDLARDVPSGGEWLPLHTMGDEKQVLQLVRVMLVARGVQPGLGVVRLYEALVPARSQHPADADCGNYLMGDLKGSCCNPEDFQKIALLRRGIDVRRRRLLTRFAAPSARLPQKERRRSLPAPDS